MAIDNERVRRDRPMEVRLALYLLANARQQMPSDYYQETDSSCKLARECLRAHGYDPEASVDEFIEDLEAAR